MTILATRIILPRVAAASPTHSSTPPHSHSSTPNGAAIAGGIAAAIAIVIAAAFRYFRRRWRYTKVSSTDAEFIIDPEPEEAGDLKSINAQPDDGIKESSDEEALGLSTMPDLPAAPTRIYNPNGAETLPGTQDSIYTRSSPPRTSFGQYQGTETTPVLVNTQAPWPQAHSVLPALPEPQYDLYARGVSQASFGQYQGTRDTSRQINTQAPRPQRHSGLPSSLEPQDEPYCPNVSTQAIFGQHQGTANILPNIRSSRPL